MFNLIKYDFKSKSKVLLSLGVLFIIENIYVILKSKENFQMNELLFVNMIFMVLIFISFSFFMNLISFRNHLSPKPGYMIFMANVSRKKYILTKIFTFFMESFVIETFAMGLFLIELKILNIDLEVFYLIRNIQGVNNSAFFIQIFKIISYLSLQYLTLITIFMLAITIRNFLIKDIKFKGLITFIIANILFFLRGYVYRILNVGFYGKFNIGDNVFSTVSTTMIFTDILYLVIIVYALIYLIERKLSI